MGTDKKNRSFKVPVGCIMDLGPVNGREPLFLRMARASGETPYLRCQLHRDCQATKECKENSQNFS